MKLFTVCGVVTSRAGSGCTEHARQSNRNRHNALYSKADPVARSGRDPAPCCGLGPANGADILILNLSACAHGYAGKRILWMALSLCELCIREAAQHGQVSNAEGLAEHLVELRKLRQKVAAA